MLYPCEFFQSMHAELSHRFIILRAPDYSSMMKN